MSLRWRMRSKLLRTPSRALYVTSLLVCGHFLNFRSNAKTQRNNYRMTECTHVPKRPFYSQNTSGCQSFLILDGLVSQSDVVVVVVVDGDVVVVVAQHACGYLDMKTAVAKENIEFGNHLLPETRKRRISVEVLQIIC